MKWRALILMGGGIPFIALLDENGEVFKQGNFDAAEVAIYLQGGRGPITNKDI